MLDRRPQCGRDRPSFARRSPEICPHARSLQTPVRLRQEEPWGTIYTTRPRPAQIFRRPDALMIFRTTFTALFCCFSLFTGLAWGQANTLGKNFSLPAPEHFHLFLLIGQSNMAGRGSVADEDRTVDPRVLMLNKDNQWAPAVDPIHFDKPAVAGVGLGRTFGLEVAQVNPGISVGLIPCAVGGSPISVWEPGKYDSATKTHPYDDAMRRVRIALKSGTLKGILWHQGESDSNPKSAPVYEEKLHELIARLREELNAPNVPFLAGQLGQFEGVPWNEHKKQVDQVHRQLPEKIAHTAFVSSKGLTHKGDNVHFDAKSYRELGKRYAKAYLDLTAGEKSANQSPGTIQIGSRRELFVDRALIEEIKGEAQLHVHQPEPGEVVLVTDKPWEGNTCAYYTIFQDGDLYRMYYRGSHWDENAKKATHREVTCYAESKDGIHWTRPNLGIVEWEGSKENNIILDGLGTHCFVAFRDDNPDCPPEAKYKGISRGSKNKKSGLFVFQSPDAIHWELIKDEPVITKGAFDSQNLAFWDPATKEYVDYHRIFVDGVRAIMTCTSKDFVHWSEPVLLKYPDAPQHHLYTNAVRPYPRAPHIRIGFPTRYIPQGSQVEPVFMASRDGVTFQRYETPVIPRTAPKDRDGNRSNYMANGLVELPGRPEAYSVYGTEAYYTGPDSRLRRFTYRLDGFVSLRAGAQDGEAITKPIEFSGDGLFVNCKTGPKGRLRVEIQEASGKPIEGFSLADCEPFSGDELDQSILWKAGDLKSLAGKPIRLRFVLEDGDLFSYQFRNAK